MTVFFLTVFLLFCRTGYAVLFYSTGDASYNTTAPTGVLTNSGWQFQGRFNQYLGTPVGPHQFITAQHLGGSVGNKFYYDGEVFTTTGKTDDPGSDLRLWEVSERFPRYAPLYSDTDEEGKGLVVFGRGVDRGAAVTNTVTSGYGPFQTTEVITNGWKWGAYNYTQRWGTNTVSATTTINGSPVLKAEWTPDSGASEGMLADKDSGGAVFIKDGETWKLAGINYVIGPATEYSLNSDGSDAFRGSILDFRGGVYTKSGTNWVSIPSSTRSAFYATRISSRYSWITNNIPDFDQDTDGLPNWWEEEYSTTATGLTASADSDGDGIVNEDEYTADTDPTNAVSYFEMTGFTASTHQTVYFNGSTGRQYQVFYTTNDLSDAGLTWLPAHTNLIRGTGTDSSITVTNAGSKAFYQLRVSLP